MAVSIFYDASDEIEIYQKTDQYCIDESILPDIKPIIKKASSRNYFYKLSVAINPEFRVYLAEMAWKNRITISEYISRLLEADKKQHPDWNSELIKEEKRSDNGAIDSEQSSC